MAESKPQSAGLSKQPDARAYTKAQTPRSPSEPWFEVVKGLRAYYDHFRIAFPDLEPLPRYYSDEWVEAFKSGARQFVRSEDMQAVRAAIERAGIRSDSPDGDNGQNGSRTPATALPELVERLRAVLGEDCWNALLDDPEAFKKVIQTTPGEDGATSGEPTAAVGPVAAEQAPATGPDAAHVAELERINKELMMEVDDMARSSKASQQEIRDLKAQLIDKDTDLQKLSAQLKKKDSQIEKLSDSAKSEPRDRRPASPSELASKLKEYEQAAAASEQRIGGLLKQVERDAQLMEELKEDLERDRNLRRKFEMEMDAERRNLREQIRRMGDLLSGGAEIPSMEEFEQMSGGELMEYIEDVENDKQRAIASLEAIDAQEQSYQSQLRAQQEELDAVQEDLEQYKESNLATEAGSLKETVERQREQLESLLNFSKNLRAQNGHLKERQEPLRRLVERLNLQEKALVRFVRMNYDRDFMPSQAFAPIGSQN